MLKIKSNLYSQLNIRHFCYDIRCTIFELRYSHLRYSFYGFPWITKIIWDYFMPLLVLRYLLYDIRFTIFIFSHSIYHRRHRWISFNNQIIWVYLMTLFVLRYMYVCFTIFILRYSIYHKRYRWVSFNYQNNLRLLYDIVRFTILDICNARCCLFHCTLRHLSVLYDL